ncbi:Diterpene synthase [Mycobacterium simulans]|uniref:Diterpene synthase n=2 Tax=Mycobacterium simulans TaxID=627089 RepID=A0A7Z7IPG2_9MYCO|nr:Diterpene synthase [Mycobacterium simulans]
MGHIKTSASSSNSRRLVEISCRANIPAYLKDSPEDIDPGRRISTATMDFTPGTRVCTELSGHPLRSEEKASHALSDWLTLSREEVARIAGKHIATTVLYFNGTRRWFRSQMKDWQLYEKITQEAHRAVSQLCYEHGMTTLIQPLLGYDLLTRGPEYMHMAMEAVGCLVTDDYRSWLVENEIQLCLYGDWRAAMTESGYAQTVEKLSQLTEETHGAAKRRLLLGLFADEGLGRIASLAQAVPDGQHLVRAYYGVEIEPVNLMIGSGQPAVWDIPLLDINKASLYFMQAPTFCLTEERLRKILYDHLYERENDDASQGDLKLEDWTNYAILGLGKRTPRGWIAT